MCPAMQVFGVVNLIIERQGAEVRPMAEVLVPLMQAVWQAGEGQSLLRIQVMVGRRMRASGAGGNAGLGGLGAHAEGWGHPAAPAEA